MHPPRANARLRRILDLLTRQPEVTVAELAERFGVTTMTVRRDLAALEQEGRVARTHGGAIPVAPQVARFTFGERRQLNLSRMQAIARAAAQRVMPGSTLIVDTGTTTLELAALLSGIPALRVLTSSLAIASELFAHENVDVVLLGGTLNRASPDLSGPLTEDNLDAFRADLAFIGADAVDRQGLYTQTQEIARVTRAMIRNAKQTVLLADSSKFEREAFARFATWKPIAAVITDGGIAPATRRWLRRCVADVTVVTRKSG